MLAISQQKYHIMKDFLGLLFLILSTEEETMKDLMFDERLMKWPLRSKGLVASLK